MTALCDGCRSFWTGKIRKRKHRCQGAIFGHSVAIACDCPLCTRFDQKKKA